MRLSWLRIENFRAFENVTLTLGEYTCLVGANGAGKSTVLSALDVFFREPLTGATDAGSLSDEDFHGKITSKPVCITLTFEDLSSEAAEAFKDYYRQGQLVVSVVATWDSKLGRAPIRHVGNRLGMVEFAPFFERESAGALVGELRGVYGDLRGRFPGLPNATSRGDMADALRGFEAANAEGSVLIPSEDQFYGWSKGANKLEQFVQWVHVPAVKDASDENREAKDTALGKLLARTVRASVSLAEKLRSIREDAQSAYGAMLTAQQVALKEVSERLEERLRSWSHPGATLHVEWADDSTSAVKIGEPAAQLIVGEDLFSGHPGRLGHGFQRSLLIALLQELATSRAGGPRLLLGCEEPELYQHPPQARYLAGVLEALSAESTQVLVCTHSPYFVVGRGFEDVRLVRKPRGTAKSQCVAVRFEQIADDIASATDQRPDAIGPTAMRLHQELQPQISEMFFANAVILVEGIEDASYLNAYMMLTGRTPVMRLRGCHVVPVGGKDRLLRPFAVARRFGLPVLVVHDADGSETNPNRRELHERDNARIQKLAGIEAPDPFPVAPLFRECLVVWPDTLAGLVKTEVGQEKWIAAAETARRRCDACGVGSLKKNVVLIGETLTELVSATTRIACLEAVAERMLALGA